VAVIAVRFSSRERAFKAECPSQAWNGWWTRNADVAARKNQRTAGTALSLRALQPTTAPLMSGKSHQPHDPCSRGTSRRIAEGRAFAAGAAGAKLTSTPMFAIAIIIVRGVTDRMWSMSRSPQGVHTPAYAGGRATVGSPITSRR